MILRAVLTVVMVLVWHHLPDRSKVMTQTKRDTLILQVGCWMWGWHSHPIKHTKSANHCYFHIHNHLALILLSWFIVKNVWQVHNESHWSVIHCSGLIKFHPWSCIDPNCSCARILVEFKGTLTVLYMRLQRLKKMLPVTQFLCSHQTHISQSL